MKYLFAIYVTFFGGLSFSHAQKCSTGECGAPLIFTIQAAAPGEEFAILLSNYLKIRESSQVCKIERISFETYEAVVWRGMFDNSDKKPKAKMEIHWAGKNSDELRRDREKQVAQMLACDKEIEGVAIALSNAFQSKNFKVDRNYQPRQSGHW